MRHNGHMQRIEGRLADLERVPVQAIPRGLTDDQRDVLIDVGVGKIIAAREAGRPVEQSKGPPVALTPEARQAHVNAIAEARLRARRLPPAERAEIERGLRGRGLL